MDTKAKRAAAEKVRRRFSREIDSLGFIRTRSSFWTKPRPHVIEFVHLHLFSVAPAFRIHLGIRVLNDSFEAVALNGPATSDSESFVFDSPGASISSCAASMAQWCRVNGEPWFKSLRDPRTLLSDDSPLDPGGRSALREALTSGPTPQRVRLSQELLGVS